MTTLPFPKPVKVAKSPKRIPKTIRRKPRTWKTVIRLEGDDLTMLRFDVWNRAEFRCEAIIPDGRVGRRCNKMVGLNGNGSLPKMDLAHIKSQGACGDDTMENCRCYCHECHMREHNGNKPVPKK